MPVVVVGKIVGEDGVENEGGLNSLPYCRCPTAAASSHKTSLCFPAHLHRRPNVKGLLSGAPHADEGRGGDAH